MVHSKTLNDFTTTHHTSYSNITNYKNYLSSICESSASKFKHPVISICYCTKDLVPEMN